MDMGISVPVKATLPLESGSTLHTVLTAPVPSIPILDTEYQVMVSPMLKVTAVFVQRNCPCGTVGTAYSQEPLGAVVPELPT